ncbi:MAG: hypothetical protein Q8906_14660 [Bacillota bacterium]|nr:hypothetical protein [Bacillota bacterium]MDP4171850.1 hypothetical protein [Bacillota bacterium]
MESIIMLSVYFLFMGSIVLLFSGLVSFFVPKVHSLVIVGVSALMGIVFSYTYNLSRFVFFAVIVNVLLSLVAVGLSRFGRYLKNKADYEMAMDK